MAQPGVRILVSTDGAQDVEVDLANITGAIEGVEQQSESSSLSLRDFGAALAGIATGAVVQHIADINIQFQSMRAQLSTLVGSTELGGQAFDALADFAAEIPGSIEDTIGAFNRLVSLGLEPSQRALESYGNTAAAMGMDLNQLVEAVADATVGEFERLKEFGIQASAQGDRVAFTFRNMTTEVGRNAEEIQEYLISIGETDFAGAVENQAATVEVSIDNLTDRWGIFVDTLLSPEWEQGFADIVQFVSDALKSITDIFPDIIAATSITIVQLQTIWRKFGASVEVIINALRKALLSVLETVEAVADFFGIDAFEGLTNFNNALRTTIEETKTYNEAARELEEREKAIIEQIRANAEARKDEKLSIDEVAASLENANRAKKDSTEADNKATESKKKLTKAIEDETKATDEAIDSDKELTDILFDFSDAAEHAANEVKELEDEATPFEESWVGAVDRVNTAFSDAWQQMFNDFDAFLDEGLSGFNDFANSIKSAFTRLLAEIAHESITRPLVANLAEGIQGLFGGLFGGGSSAGRGFGLSSLTGLISGGGGLLGTLGGLLGAGGGGTAGGGVLGGLGGLFGGGGALAGLGPIGAGAAALGGLAGILTGGFGLFGGGGGDETPDLYINAQPTSGTEPFFSFGVDDFQAALRTVFGEVTINTKGGAFGSAADAEAFFQQFAARFVPEQLIGSLLSDEQVARITDRIAQIPNIGTEDVSRFGGRITDIFIEQRLGAVLEEIQGPLGDFLNLIGDVDLSNAAEAQGLAESLVAFSNVAPEVQDTITGIFGSFEDLSRFSAEGESIGATAVRITQELLVFNDTLEDLGLALLPVTQLGIDASQAIIELSGGLESFGSSISFFYQNFFTEQERLQVILENLTEDFTQLGFVLPETREDFRSLVESLDLTTEAGQEAFVTLLELAPAFDQWVTSLELAQQEIENLEDTTEDTVDSVDDIVDTIEDLGDSAESAELQLVGLDGALSAIRRTLSDFFQSLREASRSIFEDIESLSRQILFSGFTPEQQFDFLAAESDRLVAQIDAATTPDAVAGIISEITDNVAQSYGLLDEQQQDALRQEFLDYLDSVERVAGEQLRQLEEQARTDAITAQNLAIASAQMQAAAERMNNAANQMLRAAAVPVRVQLKPAEVGI